MNTLFKGITAILPDEKSGFSAKVCDIAVSDSVISYIGDDAVKTDLFRTGRLTAGTSSLQQGL